MHKQNLIYGFAAGAILLVYIHLLDYTKLIYTSKWGAWLGYLAIIILPACIFLALRTWRREKDRLPLKHAILMGLVISCLAATVYSAYTFADIHFFGARHLQNIFDYTRSAMREAGSSEADIQKAIVRMKTHYWSAKPYLNTYIWYIGMGCISSLVSWLMLKPRISPKQTF